KGSVAGFFGAIEMVQPLIVVAIDVVMGAEGPRVELLFGALIDNGALVPREGRAVLFRLEEILTKPDMLEDEADMGGDRVVAQDRMASLDRIANAENDEGAENGKRSPYSTRVTGAFGSPWI